MSTEESGGRANPGAKETGMPESASPLAELERLQQALAEAEERARGHWEQYLRAVAELDNVRKRAQRDIEAANRYGLEKFAAELLPVRDSLELAVQSADQDDVDARVALLPPARHFVQAPVRQQLEGLVADLREAAF